MSHDLTVDRILAEHGAVIRALSKRVVDDVIEIGRRLSEAKKILGHGNWMPWLEREFAWNASTAENYINLFKLSGKFPTVGNLDLDLRSLYMLAAPSTPLQVRGEVIKRAEGGERVDFQTVRDAVRATPNASLIAPIDEYNLRKITPLTDDDHIAEAIAAVRRAVHTAMLDIKNGNKRRHYSGLCTRH